MNIPIWVAELASDFWSKAKEKESFPRQLLRPIARAVPLHIVFSPELDDRVDVATDPHVRCRLRPTGTRPRLESLPDFSPRTRHCVH